MGVRDRRATRPKVQGLEGRELLSGIIALMASEAPKAPTAIGALDVHAAAAGTGGGAGGTGGTGAGSGSSSGSGSTPSPLPAGFNSYSGNTGAVGNGQGLNNNTISPLLGNGFPSPHELARETYRAAFTGRYYTGPGRFTDQGTTYYYRGLGGSNFFLHGDFDMAIVTPTSAGGQFTGEAVLQDKSTNSAGIQGLQLAGSITNVDSQGRPTQLAFNADPGIYSGVFFADGAQGTVTIKYGANNSIKVNFDGLVYTTGLTSPLVNQDLYARHGRPVRFHPTNNLTKIHNT